MSLADLGKRCAALAATGLNRALGSRAGGRVGILAYHRVADLVAGLPAPTMNVSPQRFREQVVGLLDRGFVVWPLRKVLRHAAQQEPIPPRTLVLTFDDAYESVYLNAWPVLESLRLPATVFVSTGYLDADAPFPFDPWGVAHCDRAPAETYRPLRSGQCREMAAGELVDLGAHTHTHQDFRGRADDFHRDLATCVGLLRARFDLAEVTFAFPYGRPAQGSAGGELEAAARRAGVICGLTTESVLVDPTSGPFGWGRFCAYAWDTAEMLAAKLDGWYSWAPRLQERLSASLRMPAKHSPSRPADRRAGDSHDAPRARCVESASGGSR